MKSDRSKRRHRDKIYELLLSLCLMVLVSFAFPRLSWIGLLGYALIALLLTQLVMIRKETLTLGDRLYQLLGLGALSALLLWQITPIRWVVSGVPLVLTWSVLVGWSVIRLVKRFAQEPNVSEALLMGATAGYLHIGLTAGLVMSALQTIQPGSFEPLKFPIGAGTSVFATSHVFSTINYFAFVCLTTVGFGDIKPMLPLSRMVSVATSIAGPLYLAAVMGVLIGRFASNLEPNIVESDQRPKE